MSRAELAKYLWNLEQVADKKKNKDGSISYSINGLEMVTVSYEKKDKES